MRSFFIGLICLLVLVLTGCTAAQVSQFTQAMEESSEMYQQSTYQMMNNAQNQLPVSKPIINYNRTNQSGNYLINTDEGIEQVRCMTMSDGSVFCY